MPQTQEQIHASRARVRIVVSVAIGGLGDAEPELAWGTDVWQPMGASDE